MPKDRRDRPATLHRRRGSPYPCSSHHSGRCPPKNPLENEENVKEWEEARCPVCMEHPHNAILLLCSSHEKGCRPYMCDTSYRHSNCFDQFRKSFTKTSVVATQPQAISAGTPNLRSATSALQGEISDGGSATVLDAAHESQDMPRMICPLCRGGISGWTVVDSARGFMNAKPRSCSCEACDFSGTYSDMRKHARSVHPLARPNETDPERQRNWRRLERQRDMGDLFSTLQSFGGDHINDISIPSNEGGWLTVFFVVRFYRSGESSRTRTIIRRRSSTRLWGETTHEEPNSTNDEEDADSGDEDEEDSDSGLDS